MFERFFINDDGTLVDRTIEWCNPHTKTGAWDAKSYMYVSSYLPFNHKYIDIATANDKDGTLSIDVWWNNAWRSVGDIIDMTNNGTRSLAVSGNIYFDIDRDYGWEMEAESWDIPELVGTKVYNVYWMRIGFDADTDSALVINYIGHKFCDDTLLYTYYPMLNNSGLLTRFAAGKTNWISQEINASNVLIDDLKRRSLVISKDQIFDTKRYHTACVHKTAQLIFSALGQAYAENMNQAKKDYDDAMNSDLFGVDKNKDGVLSRVEAAKTIKLMDR